jgi:hypothetical protein
MEAIVVFFIVAGICAGLPSLLLFLAISAFLFKEAVGLLKGSTISSDAKLEAKQAHLFISAFHIFDDPDFPLAETNNEVPELILDL